jgi:malate dehydrogenase (oxaloacetate-decarboxylating)(NADP+)
LFLADTSVEEFPDAHALVEIACEAAAAVERLGFTPRVAFTSYSTFGQPTGERSEKIQEAVRLLDTRKAAFEYEGELAADVALDPDHHSLYPFSRLTEPANVLIMPAIHSASIASKLLASAGGATVIGPLLLGLSKSVQICRLGATVSDILASAAAAAYQFSQAGES